MEDQDLPCLCAYAWVLELASSYGSECQIRVVDGEIGGDTDECDVGVGRTEAIADANVGVVVVVLSGWEWEVVVLEVLGPTWGVS